MQKKKKCLVLDIGTGKKKCLSAEKMLFFRYEFLPFERKLVKMRFEEKKMPSNSSSGVKALGIFFRFFF